MLVGMDKNRFGKWEKTAVEQWAERKKKIVKNKLSETVQVENTWEKV